MDVIFNKDFYTYIPMWIQNKLDMKVLLYRNEEWFTKAWNEYRTHCMKTKVEDIQDPDYFFITKEKEYGEIKSSDEDGIIFSDDLGEGFRL